MGQSRQAVGNQTRGINFLKPPYLLWLITVLCTLATNPETSWANSTNETVTPIERSARSFQKYEQCLLAAIANASSDTTIGLLRDGCLKSLVVPIAPVAASAEPTSLFERRIESEQTAWDQPFTLMLHRPNFLLPITSQRRSSGSLPLKGYKASEAVFQISFKFPLSKPLFDGRVVPYFAYTGRSWWQVYDSDRSRPFREYNHEPEIYLAAVGFKGQYFGWQHRLTTFGFNHQSNGRSIPESRSWNRLFTEAYFDRGAGNWATVKLWYRLPERAKKDAFDQGGDDNPDINRYLGYGELRLGDVTSNNHLTLTLRRSFDPKGKGSGQIDWSRPTGFTPTLRWYAQYFDGYGESMIDYNKRVRRFGLGVMLNDWF